MNARIATHHAERTVIACVFGGRDYPWINSVIGPIGWNLLVFKIVDFAKAHGAAFLWVGGSMNSIKVRRWRIDVHIIHVMVVSCPPAIGIKPYREIIHLLV